tara:strand:+ start:534 stop:782 length:249 start_codon:yes stop_codon:yes gene_type:complete
MKRDFDKDKIMVFEKTFTKGRAIKTTDGKVLNTDLITLKWLDSNGKDLTSWCFRGRGSEKDCQKLLDRIASVCDFHLNEIRR